MSDLSGRKVLAHETLVPPAGGWYAELSLDAGALPALGPTVLTIFDLVCVGAVIRAGYETPDQPRVVAVGGAGWMRPLPRAGSYQAAGGVRLLTVLQDLAALATYEGGPAGGEGYVIPPDVPLPCYSWAASDPMLPVHGSHVLADLVARRHLATWRVDPATGRTRFDAWPSTGAADAAGVLLSPSNPARGRRVFGLGTQAKAFLPGSTAEGVLTRRMKITETAKGGKVTVWTR